MGRQTYCWGIYRHGREERAAETYEPRIWGVQEDAGGSFQEVPRLCETGECPKLDFSYNVGITL